jgi:hypothetical protein
VFGGSSVVGICRKHVQTAPEPPTTRLVRAVGIALETLVLRCLTKSHFNRSADAGKLLRELEACQTEGRWSTDEAAAWWAAHNALSPFPQGLADAAHVPPA